MTLRHKRHVVLDIMKALETSFYIFLLFLFHNCWIRSRYSTAYTLCTREARIRVEDFRIFFLYATWYIGLIQFDCYKLLQINRFISYTFFTPLTTNLHLNPSCVPATTIKYKQRLHQQIQTTITSKDQPFEGQVVQAFTLSV